MSKHEMGLAISQPAMEFDAPQFIESLRGRDAEAYQRLIRRYHASLVGVAAAVTGSRSLAEEAVQDCWISVLSGIHAFEGRCSLANWLFRIVLNRARSLVVREARMVSLEWHGGGPGEDDAGQPRLRAETHAEAAPRLWETIDAERIVAGRQLWQHVEEAIARLPNSQRAVVILRDVEGQSAADACALLNISPENQRVLLHRGRDRIRRAIDRLVSGG